MKVPFVDLDAQYQQIKPEVMKAIESVLESKKFIQGPYKEEFERNFCEIAELNHAVGCSNGTSAITGALKGLGIKPGQEVILPTNTFFATAEAVVEAGGKPVLCDIDENYGLDPEKTEAAITDKTFGMIPVHLYGNPCEIAKLSKLARKYNLKLIEDSAQAHLARHQDQAIGTFGDASTYSFYPGKNLGAYGDAGLAAFKDKEAADYAAMFFNHGRTDKYNHEFFAGNYRMDGLQAAILNVKLKYLQTWTDQRIHAALEYDKYLKDAGYKVLEVRTGDKAVYHLYIVEVSNRDEVQSYLKTEGISSGIHYPLPLHLMNAFDGYGYGRGSFPKAEKASSRILSLPIFPEITDEQVKYVAQKFLKIAKK